MRLIDADATKRRVADTYFDALIPCVNRALDDSPTVDAVPVIRCRDCRKFKTYDCRMVASGYDDFCSYGKRKEGDD